jgi:starch-binding outer membrane protein, SusD/RagB family
MTAIAGAVVLAGTTGCADSVVPYFDGVTSIPTSVTGIQQAVIGLFSGARLDVGEHVYFTASFARDFFWFNAGGALSLTYPGGLQPFTDAYGFGEFEWDNEYQQALQANNVIASLPKVSSFSPAQVAAITGMVQTMKALEFMMLAETRDTLGIPLYTIVNGPTDPPYCNKDVWAYIVALLDSGFNNLNTAGSIPLPVTVLPGYESVGQMAAPSTKQGSFAAFNRALAGKAGLELAYAIARNSPATHPTPTTPGTPDATALKRADSALTASALYNPSVIAPPAAGSFALDPYGVYHTFSGQSGDVQNAVFSQYYSYDATWDLAFDVDTVNDLRWKAKLVANPNPVPLPEYSGASDDKNFLPYASVSSPMPIVRAEELALVMAQIQLAMGNYAAAISLINQVHQQAGGFATPLSIAPTYTAVRDSLLKEQRISTLFEASADRSIALRMYNLEAIADTTW